MDKLKRFHLENILSWSKYFVQKNLSPADHSPGLNENFFSVNPELNEQVSLWEGDITKLEVDAIVNAANESLLGGDGVDGAINKAAGSDLVKECAKLGGCQIGEAKITSGFNLPSKYIIHTVGPRDSNRLKLRECYKNSLKLMKDNGLKSISFPCISSGIYGYPNEDAAHVALLETRNFLLENPQIKRVIFCTFLEKDTKIYEELMQRYFPVINNSLSMEEIQENLKKSLPLKDYELLTKKPVKFQKIKANI